MQKLETILKKSGVAVIPTDTIYGIVGSALSKKTVERIYELKGRDDGKPCITLISSYADLKKFGVVLTPSQKKILSRAWPGPVSVILPCTQKKFEYLHRGTKSLAFRMPKTKKLQDLLKKTGPLIAPSANLQGAQPAETIAEAKAYFGDTIDIYSSGGRKKGKPSTLISLLDNKVVVLRQGAKKISISS